MSDDITADEWLVGRIVAKGPLFVGVFVSDATSLAMRWDCDNQTVNELERKLGSCTGRRRSEFVTAAGRPPDREGPSIGDVLG